jgi:two-component system phosphate regulon sensor histidine kinase PhoR
MAMTTASELLSRQSSSEKQQELLEMIRREITRLTKLTRDFLELSRLESGRVHLSPEPVDLARLVHHVISLLEAQAAVRGITLHQDVAPNLPLVSVDPGRLEQVLLNLVSNAIKYNHPNGSVLVCVQLVNNQILVQVSDTGRGIESKSLAHLFERFYRVPDSEGFSEGTGLGLAITQKIVEAHGGRIEVTSQIGKGSVFTCFLPLL